MRKGACNKVSISLACLLGLALLLTAGTALAKKPPKPDPDPDPVVTGVIYFEDADGGLAYVPADGSAEPTAMYVPVGEISTSLHDGNYWVLYTDLVQGAEPDGTMPRREMFVEPVDASMQSPIELTVGPLLSLSDGTLSEDGFPLPTVAWGPGDNTLQFVALEWASDAAGAYVVVGAGIYEVELTWSANGSGVSAGVPVRIADGSWRETPGGQPRPEYGDTIDTSPDEAALTTSAWDPAIGEWFVTTIDLADNDAVRLCDGRYPAWSPDGDWIYFTRWFSGIHRVSVDGVDDEEVLDPEDSRKFIYDALGPMRWSPDGGAFAYRHKSVKLGRLPQDAVTTNEIATYDLTSGQSTILCEGLRALAWRP